MIHQRLSQLGSLVKWLVRGAVVAVSLTIVQPARGESPAGQLPENVELSGHWMLQDASRVPAQGEALSTAAFNPDGWHAAVVPGTVLTSLVADGTYPDPLYGENNRPDKIPDSLCRTDWWYRTSSDVPSDYAGRHIWLNFSGINYAAEAWVNGSRVGEIKGAFLRGIFDITSLVAPGKAATLAVRVHPQPHPGEPHEHTIAAGMGKNGGITASDGPTFLCTINWDWIPGIRDRDTGIWQKVFLSATGPVTIADPHISTDLSLPTRDLADIAIQTQLVNHSDKPVDGTLTAGFDDVRLAKQVHIDAGATADVSLNPQDFPQLHLLHPRLWWPHGYGPQNLYDLHLSFSVGNERSDRRDVRFGIRKFGYESPDSKNLALSVNGVRVVAKGGDWGMDEAMKRIDRTRLDAMVRMHQQANYNIIRNWVGQSTSDDLYDLCDRYGIMLWDEYFQPNPADGPDPLDHATYLANVEDKLKRYRNHPCIVVLCARNEGHPPKDLDDKLHDLTQRLVPEIHYQSSSGDGGGVRSGGPYRWRKPSEYYGFPVREAFKTEIGSVSVPTLESIQGMLEEKDWNNVDDAWAEHDLAKGAQAGQNYVPELAARYGPPVNLADFARKGQMMNYEAFRAMYEGRFARIFNPVTGVITWMSNPAQPSFVWQLYHHDLEPCSSLFAVRSACEPVHVQLNEKTLKIQVINHTDADLPKAQAALEIYDIAGNVVLQKKQAVAAPARAAKEVAPYPAPTEPGMHLVRLTLTGASGDLLSENWYWRAEPPSDGDLTGLGKLAVAPLQAELTRRDNASPLVLDVKLTNTAKCVAVMTHLQLHSAKTKARVLPVFYSDNYVSLPPGGTKTVTIEAPRLSADDKPVVMIDGWNTVAVESHTAAGDVMTNANAQVGDGPAVFHWPQPKPSATKPGTKPGKKDKSP